MKFQVLILFRMIIKLYLFLLLYHMLSCIEIIFATVIIIWIIVIK